MRLGHEAFRPYVEKVRGWNQEKEEQGFLEHFEIDKIQIIQVDDQDAGYFKLDKAQDGWFLEGLYIGKAYRNKGLGSVVLQDILSLAKEAKKEVKLQVFKHNPAWHLYQRLGFVITEQSESHFYLLWKAC